VHPIHHQSTEGRRITGLRVPQIPAQLSHEFAGFVCRMYLRVIRRLCDLNDWTPASSRLQCFQPCFCKRTTHSLVSLGLVQSIRRLLLIFQKNGKFINSDACSNSNAIWSKITLNPNCNFDIFLNGVLYLSFVNE